MGDPSGLCLAWSCGQTVVLNLSRYSAACASSVMWAYPCFVRISAQELILRAYAAAEKPKNEALYSNAF